MNIKQCTVEGCRKVHYAKGYCRNHYVQNKKLVARKNKNDICNVDGCGEIVVANGYCSKHYQQIRNHGTLQPDKERVLLKDELLCSVPGCNREHKVKGMCRMHYNSSYRENKFYCHVKGCGRTTYMEGKCKEHYNDFVNDKSMEGACKVDGCENERYCSGYCLDHYKKKLNDRKLTKPKDLDLTEKCMIDGCNGKKYSSGVCKSCYSRYKRYGYLTDINGNKITDIGIKLRKCKVDGCDGLVVSCGYCSTHYNQYKKYGAVVLDGQDDLLCICNVDGCDEIVHRNGMCKLHYEQIRLYGRILNNPLIREVLPPPIQKLPEPADMNLIRDGVISRTTKSRFQHIDITPQRILILGDIDMGDIQRVSTTIDTIISTYFKNERIELMHLAGSRSYEVVSTISRIRELCLMDIDLQDPESVLKSNSDIIDCCDIVLYFVNSESENCELINMISESNVRGFKVKI